MSDLTERYAAVRRAYGIETQERGRLEAQLAEVYAGRVHVDALSEALGDVSNDVDGFVSVAEVIAAIHNARDLS